MARFNFLFSISCWIQYFMISRFNFLNLNSKFESRLPDICNSRFHNFKMFWSHQMCHDFNVSNFLQGFIECWSSSFSHLNLNYNWNLHTLEFWVKFIQLWWLPSICIKCTNVFFSFWNLAVLAGRLWSLNGRASTWLSKFLVLEESNIRKKNLSISFF